MKVVDQSGFIQELLAEIGLEVSKNHLVDIEGPEKLLLINAKELDLIKDELIDQSLGVIIFGETKIAHSNIIGHFPLKLNQNQKHILKNIINTVLNLRDEKDKERFITTKIYERLLEIEKNSEQHSQNLRRISRSLIPRRFSNFKGIEIAARYQPGSRVGSEYYDAYFNGHEGVILLITSSSYLLSTVSISLFSELKTHSLKANKVYEQFIKDLADEYHNLGADQDLSLTLLKINTRTLTLKGLNYGDQIIGTKEQVFDLPSSANISFSENNIDIKLKPNEPFYIGSRGLKRQLDQSDNFKVLTQLASKFQSSVQDIADEVFLTLKKNDNGFLEWDASILVMEATKNALYSL